MAFQNVTGFTTIIMHSDRQVANELVALAKIEENLVFMYLIYVLIQKEF